MSELTTEGRYATRGIESKVRTRGGDVTGHVGLLDLDECSEERAREVATHLPGMSVLLRSSEECYHVWGLTVRSLDAWLQIGHNWSAVSGEHLDLSAHRDCFRLRVEPKISLSDGSHHAPTPEPIEVLEGLPTDDPLSQPHMEWLIEELGVAESELSEAADTRARAVGDSLTLAEYMAHLYPTPDQRRETV